MANEICPICHKKVKSFSKQIKCYNCHSLYHGNCINWTREDILYANNWHCNICLDDALPYHHVDDDADFMAAISENIFETNFMYKELDQMIFNPFEINDFIDNPMNDIDPDFHFYSEAHYIESTQCDYYLEDKFVSRISSSERLQRSLSLFHMNIRSLPKHFDELDMYLESLKFMFSIIGLTETWLDESKEELYSLKNYQSINEYRKGKTGGGVSMFIHENIKFTRRSDLQYFDSEMESIFIELDKSIFSTKSNIIVGLIYRMPDSSVEIFNARIII